MRASVNASAALRVFATSARIHCACSNETILSAPAVASARPTSVPTRLCAVNSSESTRVLSRQKRSSHRGPYFDRNRPRDRARQSESLTVNSGRGSWQRGRCPTRSHPRKRAEDGRIVRSLSKCHAVPPHIGHLSGAIRELAPYAQTAHLNRVSETGAAFPPLDECVTIRLLSLLASAAPQRPTTRTRLVWESERKSQASAASAQRTRARSL